MLPSPTYRRPPPVRLEAREVEALPTAVDERQPHGVMGEEYLAKGYGAFWLAPQRSWLGIGLSGVSAPVVRVIRTGGDLASEHHVCAE